MPRRGRATLYSYVSRLRQALTDVDGVTIERRSGGYVLTTDPARPLVDLARFRKLCGEARASDDPARVALLLTEALHLWRGEALTGLGGYWAEAERDRLQGERRTVEHDLVDARLRQGEGEQLLTDLSLRAREHPFDERVTGQYMLALHQAGQATVALDHYRRVRTRMIEELGTDPGVELERLHRRILAADPALVAGRSPGLPVPRQLPAAQAPLAGRRAELSWLDLEATSAVSAVTGAGGIGKTWLVLNWAYRAADRFPDGQLFVDLQGFSHTGQSLTPASALRGFLEALGVEPGRVPADLHARAALFRSLTAGKRMLVVLDNAAATDQVTPLLPGGSSVHGGGDQPQSAGGPDRAPRSPAPAPRRAGRHRRRNAAGRQARHLPRPGGTRGGSRTCRLVPGISARLEHRRRRRADPAGAPARGLRHRRA